MRWKRLLVPHDFSACADGALNLAVQFAQEFGATIELLHVADAPLSLPGSDLARLEGVADAVPLRDYVGHDVTKKLEALAARLRARGVAVATTVAIGDIAETILEEGDGRKVDAIIIGTHGRTGLVHLLLGSVAEKVVRGATVPVVTVRTASTYREEQEEEISEGLVPTRLEEAGA
jgi:nucleotide-binding universal stress UspA family protein